MPVHNLRTIVLTAAASLTILAASAAETTEPSSLAGNYFVQTWQEEEGLPRNTITGVAQTPDGYLWLGTQFGLVRFDGVRFVTYGAEVLPELVKSMVWLLRADRAGRLWMGTGTGGLIIYDRGQFKVLDERAGFAHRTIYSLCEDDTGAMWVSTGDASLYSVRDGSRVEKHGPLRGQASETPVYLARDLSGTLWFAQGDLYGQLEDGQATNVTRIAGSVVKLCPSRDGLMWVSANRRLFKASVQGLKTGSSISMPFGNYQVRSMLEDRNGVLWIGSRDSGVYQLQEGELRLALPARSPVRDIFEDAEGSLWFTPDGGGLNRVRPRIFHVLDSQRGLPNDQAVTLCEGATGDIWIGTQVGGLSRFRASSGVQVLSDTTNLMITSVYPAGTNGVWAGTVAGGLVRHDGTISERVLNYSPFRDRQIRVLQTNEEGHLWMALFPSGVAKLKDGQPIWPAYYRGIGIPIHACWAVAEASDGALWMGFISGMVTHLKGDQVTLYGKEHGLPGVPVGALYLDKQGTLWVGTMGGGIGCLQQDRFKFVSVKGGLHDNVISQIVEDDLGFMWFGSSRGLFRVGKSGLEAYMAGTRSRIESIRYGKSDGLINVECRGGYQPSVWKTRTGELWFATSKGAIHFAPGELPLNTNPPPLVLEKVLVNGEETASRGPLRLNWNHNGVGFEYTALSFVSPEKVRFRRQLVGVDPDWVDAGGSRSALYPRLSPGEYEFRFTACNNDEIWNEEPVRLRVTVVPAIWQTGWFRVLGAVVFAGLIAVMVRYYSTLAMRRRLAKLEQAHAVEQERTRIARDIHDDVGARLTQMAYLSDLVVGEAPEGRHSQHLQEIARASRQTVRALDEIVWAVNPRKDSLPHLVEYISQYANSVFRNTNVRCRQDLPVTLPDWHLPAEFRHHLFLAAKEALTNIQKHARATEIWIRVRFEAPLLEVTIEDNGAGFTVSEARSERNGLQNMHARLATLKGTCSITSEPGKGTCLVMRVSLPPAEGGEEQQRSI